LAKKKEEEKKGLPNKHCAKDWEDHLVNGKINKERLGTSIQRAGRRGNNSHLSLLAVFEDVVCNKLANEKVPTVPQSWKGIGLFKGKGWAL